ncbi:ABC transporter transmembrane domain-containing protein [Mechercharimyces sp. CAU 1602]|uniref:ABC transporter transmembrane domain-containing protein n=1 Tax=Mechercharimyces sp. CAU 1602 TaxID=2973933 RepID=UPI00216340AF|nr:ABC transporter transmembrane domain-containing protein [Mechercharimyces sp. CAU 1602]MCS1351655.1 ABC transporter transmembrane domain-containing protein [Mechercharimyces sp. CAU 1602]
MSIFKELAWFFKEEKKVYIIGVSLLFMVALLELLPPYVVGKVVDGIAAKSMTLSTFMKWMLTIAGAALFMYGLRYVWRILIFGASFRLGKTLRSQLMEHYTRMSPSFFQQRRTGDLMAHATNDVQAVRVTAGEGVLTLIDSLVMGGLVIIAMAVFVDWRLTLIALIPMPVMAFAVSRYGKLTHQRFMKAQASFSDLNDKVQENTSGVRVIKAFGQEEAEKESFYRLSHDVVEKNMSVARVESLFAPTISLMVGTSIFLAIAVGSLFVTHGTMSLGELFQFTMYLGLLVWPMLAFGFLMNILQRGRASYDRIRTLLKVKPAIIDEQGAVDQAASGTIQFKVGSFTYPESESPALQNIDVRMNEGETLGIVGKTGSGKTTLLRLLLREFECEDGNILIGERPIQGYTLFALRSVLGYVPQDHFLFSTTIAENIAYGKRDATQRDIEKAARIAQIHEDILHFEHGYETVVGERGVTLSGGQKQRLAMARALLLDPEILILDDSLSAVDAKTEERILHELKMHRHGKTTIISAHRLSGIEHADQIIVLEEGRLVEQGTHQQLLQVEGVYEGMYRRQQLESLIQKGGGPYGDSSSTSLS